MNKVIFARKLRQIIVTLDKRNVLNIPLAAIRCSFGQHVIGHVNTNDSLGNACKRNDKPPYTTAKIDTTLRLKVCVQVATDISQSTANILITGLEEFCP